MTKNSSTPTKEVIKYNNDAVYEGYIVNGMKEGRGVQTWPDGSEYDGEWKENTAWGEGTLRHPDGSRYEGRWMHNHAHGYGRYIS
jgi:hypothetical protein